jgi:DNA-binding NarL/FixJ family response regulator
MMTKLRVVLVDDHAILREGLRVLIAAQTDMEVVGEAADGQSAVKVVEALRPDVIVMDISMPHLSGTDATRQIQSRFPAARVLVLTAHEDSVYIQLLLEAGASGYLLKRAAAADLIRAIRAVAAGQLYLDTTSAAQIRVATESSALPPPPSLAKSDPRAELSDREAEVLRMIALGYSMKRMAEKLGLSTRTLETYKHRGMAKLELENRAEVVRLALQKGWLKDS